MKCWSARLLLCAVLLSLLSVNTPAPLIYRPGEGWTYEPPGGTSWTRTRAKDQLDVAQQAFDAKDYDLAVKAARRLIRVWPFSDYAPEAKYLVGRGYEARGQDEKAFRAYQELIEEYPKAKVYNDVLERQFLIANRFLGGQWFKLWGWIPFFPSMDKTVEMYKTIIEAGPYSPVAPKAQMNIGVAREKQSDYPAAVEAYETAADRYHDKPSVAADAIFKAGEAYLQQAQTAEYDQSIAEKAIASFTDFITLYPSDPRVPEARSHIAALETEQARGSFLIARFYEKKKEWDGALVYYNDVILQDPQSSYAEEARQRIEEIRERTTRQASAR